MSMMVGRGADVPETVNKSAKDECGRQVTGDTPWKSSQVKSSQVKSRNLPRAPPPLPQVLTGSYDPLDIKGTTENVYRVVASYWASGIPCTARARRAVVASMDPMQRAARHAMRWQTPPPSRISWPRWRGAGERRTIQPRGSRRRARRAAVLAARVMGGARRCTDDTCEESHAAARGGDGTAARARARRRGRRSRS